MRFIHDLDADEGLHPAGRLDAVRDAAERAFLSLDGVEVEIVRRTVQFSSRHGLNRVARAATSLGNGWLYPFLSLALVIGGRLPKPLRFTLCSALTFLIAFSVYPTLKRFLARSRPCDYDASLVCGIAPLDRYSCPSGHAMTAVAYSIPLMFALPGAVPLTLMMCATIAWSRVALGHHYVSDVLVGGALGAAIATPVAVLML